MSSNKSEGRTEIALLELLSKPKMKRYDMTRCICTSILPGNYLFSQIIEWTWIWLVFYHGQASVVKNNIIPNFCFILLTLSKTNKSSRWHYIARSRDGRRADRGSNNRVQRGLQIVRHWWRRDHLRPGQLKISSLCRIEEKHSNPSHTHCFDAKQILSIFRLSTLVLNNTPTELWCNLLKRITQIIQHLILWKIETDLRIV